ncbi:hypothetical protein FACS1894206_09690 [Deltaproteobacteria bacterium]|nr:hypothetical protein FACS1894206_09690 [Deltaproteobacteria bacterium]
MALQRNDLSYFRTFTNVRWTRRGALLTDKYIPQSGSDDIYEAFLLQMSAQIAKHHDEKGMAIKYLQSLSMESAMDKISKLCSWDIHLEKPNQHINWFTEAKLFKMLKIAGFSTIKRSGYGQSISRVMRNRRYFDTTRPNFSLYMEAIKD